jgi:hypothetical protein
MLLTGPAFRIRNSQADVMMNNRKLLMIGVSSMALLLVPTLSTVGVTGANDLITGRTAIIQAIPINTDSDRSTMSAIDTQIGNVVLTAR